MKRYATVAAFLAALVLGMGIASSAFAHPTQASACKNCHTKTTAVTLVVTPVSTSSTTATYTVTVGNPYGTNGWGVFGTTKLAGAAGSGSTFAVPVGATYTVYGVSGNNNGTEGYNSTTISPVKPTTPATPTIAASFTTTTGAVAVSWSTVAGATSYDYQVGSGPVLSTAGNSAVVSGLAVGTTPFQVRAVANGIAGGWGASSLIYTLPVLPPAAPSISTTYTTVSGSVTISWAGVSGATSYDYQLGAGSVISTSATSVTLNGLSGGTTAFKLRATNSAGSSAYSAANIVYTPLPASAPSISATYTTTNGSVTISWPAVSWATSYDYQVGAGSVLSTTTTSVTLSGLAAGTTAFKVRATNTAGSSAYSAANIVYTPAPAAPVISPTYTTTNGSVSISWTAVAGATSYDYQVGAGSVLSTTTTSVTLTGLSTGTTAFKVRATNASGSSAYAVCSIVNTPAPASPPSINATYTTSANSVTIAWTAVSGATSYDYQVGAGSIVSTTSTSVTVTGLSVGTTAFKVRATNSTGSSSYANASIVYSIPQSPPANPPSINTTYTTSVNSVTISWAAVSGAATYDYQVGSGSVVSTTSTSVTVTGLSVGTTAFKIRATNNVGSSAYANASIVFTPPPATPSIATTYTTANGSVTISWAAVSGATSYDYQVGGGSVVSTTATSVSLSGLSAGTTAFQVRATNGSGSSAYSAATIVYTPVPAAPSLDPSYPTATSSVTISWAAVPWATSYNYQVGSGSVLTTTSTSVTLSGLSAGTTAFKVRATNSSGSSAYATASVIYTPVPATPSINATYATTNGSVTISWTAVTWATGYDYQVGSGSVVSTTATSVTVSGLSAGTTAFKLRATNGSGASAYATSSLVNTPPPAAPSIDAEYHTNNGSVTISWAAVPGATGYDYQLGSGAALSTTQTSVAFDGLALGTTAFKVRAKNTSGSSAYASASIVYSLLPPDAPVLDPTYNTVDGNVHITWAAVTGATSYGYSLNGGTEVTTTDTFVDLSGLAQGTSSFALHAINGGGAGADAVADIVYTPPAIVPAAPTLAKSYTAAQGTVVVTWPAVNGATSYKYYFTGGAENTVNTNSVSLSGLVFGTSQLHICSVSSAGESAYSTTQVINNSAPVSPALKLVTLRTQAGRRVYVGGYLTGAVPVGVVSIRVYVLNSKTHKYVRYAYSTKWNPGTPKSTFSQWVRPSRAGRAYAVIVGDGIKIQSKYFTVKK